jgi:DNA-binding HxlR family transcriptional regulator
MEIIAQKQCKAKSLALRDAITLLTGKWKICILRNLSFGTMRFKDLLETVEGISPRVLTRELRELETNYLITRTINNSRPVTVSYALTTHAKETQYVVDALIKFGEKHRNKIKESTK